MIGRLRNKFGVRAKAAMLPQAISKTKQITAQLGDIPRGLVCMEAFYVEMGRSGRKDWGAGKRLSTKR